MEEALGKLDISEEEATPLIIDDSDEGSPQKWLIAGKVLFRNLLHIRTIQSALRPAWGNPQGLIFRSLGENMFAAEFESKRDRDRVWEGSPWHINKHAVILQDFEEHMQPSELVFDSLPVWVRVVNLPYNFRNNKWGLAIAQQIDKKAAVVQIDPVGGFLRARVSIDVQKPLRRWILIDSAKRKSTDKYDIEYEHIPHFCFSCGRLGHADPFCPAPDSRDEKGELSFKPSLRASDDRRRSNSGEHQPKTSFQNTTRESRASSSKKKEGVEVTSPVKAPVQQKLRHVPAVESDHYFVMVSVKEEADLRSRGARPFRYEDAWQTHADYDQLVLDSWRLVFAIKWFVAISPSNEGVLRNLNLESSHHPGPPKHPTMSTPTTPPLTPASTRVAPPPSTPAASPLTSASTRVLPSPSTPAAPRLMPASTRSVVAVVGRIHHLSFFLFSP
ncbi:hypothetical protein D1007_47222 [Hordeum vulgare]|nr:hypothetical protein D1007_47222 [Hordeum vulgare]